MIVESIIEVSAIMDWYRLLATSSYSVSVPHIVGTHTVIIMISDAQPQLFVPLVSIRSSSTY